MSELQIKTRVLSSLMIDMKNNKINVNHPLQRQSGQWTKQQMCRLIYCLIDGRAMPTFLFSKNHGDNVLFVIDGKQRLTNIYSYINNEFKLGSDYDSVVIDDVEYDVSNKFFKDLDDNVQEALMNRELITQIMIDANDKYEREAFADFNSTPSLANSQMRKVHETKDLMEVLEELRSKEFIKKVLSGKQLLKDNDNELILQVLMLTEISKDNDSISFSDSSMKKFVKMYGENINYDKITIVSKALDILNDNFKFKINVKKTTLPMVIYGMYRVVKDNKSSDKYIEWLKDFLQNYENNEEYLKFVKNGTSSAKSVKGRFDYFRNVIKKL